MTIKHWVAPRNWGTGLLLVWIGLGSPVARVTGAEPRVQLTRVPHGGIQPQAAVDDRGAVHLVFFKGSPAGGDLYYVRRPPARSEFTEPIRVNRQAGSAIATGTIRGAQLAVGRSGRIHVVWNGSQRSDRHSGAPLWYTRLDEQGLDFEPERDVITHAAGLDGGGSVAADPEGNVYVVWHAPGAADAEDETDRAVFLTRSTDDGRTFAREEPVTGGSPGVCACCGLRAFADGQGRVLVLYRGATSMSDRPATWLVSGDRASRFLVAGRQPWRIATCPMSSGWLAQGRAGILTAWEAADHVYWSWLDPVALTTRPPAMLPNQANAKHPIVVENARGELLAAWTEGTGWERGGAVAWQLMSPAGEKLDSGRTNGVPAWSLVAAVPGTDGGFTVIY